MKSAIIIIVMVASILGPSIVVAVMGYAVIQALGRNPSAFPKILLPLIWATVLSESVAIIALLVLFQLLGQ